MYDILSPSLSKACMICTMVPTEASSYSDTLWSCGTISGGLSFTLLMYTFTVAEPVLGGLPLSMANT